MNERKLAVFVEGQTEQIFVERLVREIAGQHRVEVETFKAEGGGASGPRRMIRISGARPPATRYYVQIVDSASDGRVVSDVRDNYAGLVQRGFAAIVGLRDVYPIAHADIPNVRAAVSSVLPSGPVAIDLVLAIMEVEAWFLADFSHFSRIGRGIAIADILRHLGFDPSVEDMELRLHPAADLNAAYQLGGSSYNKSRATVQATVNALDYEYLYLTLKDRMGSFGHLVGVLDRFLSS